MGLVVRERRPQFPVDQAVFHEAGDAVPIQGDLRMFGVQMAQNPPLFVQHPHHQAHQHAAVKTFKNPVHVPEGVTEPFFDRYRLKVFHLPRPLDERIKHGPEHEGPPRALNRFAHRVGVYKDNLGPSVKDQAVGDIDVTPDLASPFPERKALLLLLKKLHPHPVAVHIVHPEGMQEQGCEEIVAVLLFLRLSKLGGALPHLLLESRIKAGVFQRNGRLAGNQAKNLHALRRERPRSQIVLEVHDPGGLSLVQQGNADDGSHLEFTDVVVVTEIDIRTRIFQRQAVPCAQRVLNQGNRQCLAVFQRRVLQKTYASFPRLDSHHPALFSRQYQRPVLRTRVFNEYLHEPFQQLPQVDFSGNGCRGLHDARQIQRIGGSFVRRPEFGVAPLQILLLVGSPPDPVEIVRLTQPEGREAHVVAGAVELRVQFACQGRFVSEAVFFGLADGRFVQVRRRAHRPPQAQHSTKTPLCPPVAFEVESRNGEGLKKAKGEVFVCPLDRLKADHHPLRRPKRLFLVPKKQGLKATHIVELKETPFAFLKARTMGRSGSPPLSRRKLSMKRTHISVHCSEGSCLRRLRYSKWGANASLVSARFRPLCMASVQAPKIL